MIQLLINGSAKHDTTITNNNNTAQSNVKIVYSGYADLRKAYADVGYKNGFVQICE